eukprot:jgi/Mesvir1/17300/Mv07699-RA.1
MGNGVSFSQDLPPRRTDAAVADRLLSHEQQQRLSPGGSDSLRRRKVFEVAAMSTLEGSHRMPHRRVKDVIHGTSGGMGHTPRRSHAPHQGDWPPALSLHAMLTPTPMERGRGRGSLSWQCRAFNAPRDKPPKRETGIAREVDMGIDLSRGSDCGTTEDGSTWWRESGEELGENGYRSRWAIMSGRSLDGSNEWKETWWEKSDWSGYKELGAEKSGRNKNGDVWWETWKEVFRQEEWSGLANIERSAEKQASSPVSGEWREKWWEKYNAKGWTEKGAHKHGHFGNQSWWEKWGEQYDGMGAFTKWTDKWAESENGSKWGDKWEERFDANGAGTKKGETWSVNANNERWTRTWGEEHRPNRVVRKYGHSTSGEQWDVIVMGDQYALWKSDTPHYGWADAIGASMQLLSIQPREKGSSSLQLQQEFYLAGAQASGVGAGGPLGDLFQLEPLDDLGGLSGSGPGSLLDPAQQPWEVRPSFGQEPDSWEQQGKAEEQSLGGNGGVDDPRNSGEGGGGPGQAPDTRSGRK